MLFQQTFFQKAVGFFCLSLAILLITSKGYSQSGRTVADFDKGWPFHPGDVSGAEQPTAKDADWRTLNLPHDWSIEGTFSKDNPATPEGGALPGGIRWERKTFNVPASSKDKLIYIDFDGVYQKSTVYINGHELGFRPNGYISFRYELTPYLNFGGANIIAVKVDNSVQPNSRWYSGSGIYRNVWLVTTSPVAVDHWGTFVTTTDVSSQSAMVHIETHIKNNTGKPIQFSFITNISDGSRKQGSPSKSSLMDMSTADTIIKQDIKIKKPN